MTSTLAQDLGGVVRPEDLKFSEYPGRISGGMSVGMPKGVMAVHLPTGIKVVCNHHRSQHLNRDACIRAIEAAIQDRTHSAEIAGALRDAGTVIRVGNYGAAFDPPGSRRAFTYQHQPGNVDASRLGRAADEASKASAGDSIDRGLALLRALRDMGFGVYQISDAAMQQGGGGGEAAA